MRLKLSVIAALTGALTSIAPNASAQTTDDWQFRAIIYGYFPDIGGSTSFPAGTGGGNIDVSASNIIDSLKFTFMGTFEARKGRWGGLVDFMYLNLGGSQTETRNLTVLGRPLPIGATADLDLDLKGSILTLGGEYAAIADPGASLDLVAGARMISVNRPCSGTSASTCLRARGLRAAGTLKSKPISGTASSVSRVA